MHQVVFLARMRPGIAKVGSVSKHAMIAAKAPLDLLDSLCALFLRNLTLVGGATIFAAICLPSFSRYSFPCCSWVLVVPLSKVGTPCMRKVIPYWCSLVVLHVLPISADICRKKASILVSILDADTRGAVVVSMLSFLLLRTPIGSASLLLHLVSSSIMMLCYFGSMSVMSDCLPVVMMRFLFSLR